MNAVFALLFVAKATSPSLPASEIHFLKPPLLPPEVRSQLRPRFRAQQEPRTFFLNFAGGKVKGGSCSDALTGCSFIVRVAGDVTYPPFSGGSSTKQRILDLVREYYEP